MRVKKFRLFLLSLMLPIMVFSTLTITGHASPDEVLIDSQTTSDIGINLTNLHPSDTTAFSALGQSFTNLGGTYKITTVSFRLFKGGSPTGIAHAVLYEHSGTYGSSSKPTGVPLATSNGFDVSTLSAGPTWINFTFTFPELWVLAPNAHYCIAFQNPESGVIDAGNHVGVRVNQTECHSGNPFEYNVNGWTSYSYDTVFRVYGEEGEFIWYTFKGAYDEDTGLLKDASERAVNVTSYFATGIAPQTFEVNGTYVYISLTPLYFLFDTSLTREYWIPQEENQTIYIFDTTLTAYYLTFLDLAGALEEYAWVSASRYINGTLTVVEKRKVDVLKSFAMSLKNGVKYTIQVEAEAGTPYTFGDLLMTSDTTVELIIKGVEFPKETLLTYKNVRIYGTRTFADPNGSIAITYEDLLEQTVSVAIYVNYKNGTNAYNATETADSFIHTWPSALNNTDYAVVANINHTKYGTWTWKQYFPRPMSEVPWGLDWLGDLPFDTSVIIPAFIIIFVAGCFSVLNAEVGAFMAVVTAIILTYMGWIQIPGGILVTAIVLAILMGLIYAKRRVQT